MSRRISVITLHRVKNYGSVLQAYATQAVLSQLGYDVEFVDYTRPDLGDSLRDVIARSKWNNNPLRRLIYAMVWGKQVSRQRQIFNSFVDEHLNLSTEKYKDGVTPVGSFPPADIRLVGSDQVWNDDYNVGGSEPFYFAGDDSAPRLSYAASYGKGELSSSEVMLAKQELRKFTAISVREESAVQALKALDIDATWVLDPTLLLDRSEWSKLAGPPPTQKPYLLVYQLNPSDHFERIVEELSITLDLPIIRIRIRPHLLAPKRKDLLQPQVTEWLGAFQHARYVVTDSFHGAAFSANFQVNFSVFPPPKYSARLNSFLTLIGAEARMIGDQSIPRTSEMDWEIHSSKLREARNASKTWLAEALRNA